MAAIVFDYSVHSLICFKLAKFKKIKKYELYIYFLLQFIFTVAIHQNLSKNASERQFL